MENLLHGQSQVSQLAQTAWTLVMNYAPKVLLAILLLVVGMILINRLVQVVDHKLSQKDPTLVKFLCGLTGVILKILLIISAASMIGIETTSFIAVLGAAGLAVGLALQGSLANFAGGMLILIFKPFKVGDLVEAQGYLGTVAEIQMLYTLLDTLDNRRIIIPNGALSNGNLMNYSTHGTRRVDMAFDISYGDDMQKAKNIIRELINKDPRALKTPEPLVVIGSLADSSVKITVRIWSKSEDYWAIYWDMQEGVKNAFDAQGISIPFPQQDIYLHQAK